jgi:hypothetical protein
MIHTRFYNGEMAELLLEIWQRVYTNEGHGTLHDCNFPGFTLIGSPSILTGEHLPEKMQMDAGMGVTAAILDMMLHTRRGVNYVFAGAPSRWQRVSFDGIRTEGAFLVGAERVDGRVTEIRVLGEQGGTFRVDNPWAGPAVAVDEDGTRQEISGQVLSVELTPGQTVVLYNGRGDR